MSNERQIVLGSEQYRADNRDDVPLPASRFRNSELQSWCSWTYGGKDTSEHWARGQGQIHDIAAGARPLNQYLYGEIIFPTPVNRNEDWKNFKPGRPPEPRGEIELEAYRSPGDKVSYQHGSVNGGPEDGPKGSWPGRDYSISSYDDVGTSYHSNMYWWEPLLDQYDNDWTKAWFEGLKRLKLAGDFSTSTFVWMYDQTADVSANAVNTFPDGIMGEFGELNKSVIGFYDGHVDYVSIVPGAPNTEDYQLHFVMPGDDK
jgi:hypothetical protein